MRQTFDRWIQDHAVETEPDPRAAAMRGCRSYRAWLVTRALTALVVGFVVVAGLVGLRAAIAGPQDLRITAALTLYPDRGSTPLTVTADASVLSAAPGTELKGFAFDFGDGHRVGPGPEAQAKYTYQEVGVYKVTVTVTDAEGRGAQASGEVTVTEPEPSAPTARLRVKPGSDRAPLAVVADGSKSEAAPGTELETFAFDFGDGHRVGPGPEAQAKYTYQEAGTYKVTLTVTDKQGRHAQDSREVTVTAPRATEPAPSNPTVRLRVRGSGAPMGVVADGSRSEAAPGTKLEAFEFDFGDGYQVGPGPKTEAKHTYQVPGQYEVTMTVTDDHGRSHRASRKVTVTEPDDPTPSPTASR